MKRTLQSLAALVALAGILIWISAGGRRGWTQTSTPVTSIDQVTGLEGITYQQRFLPGLDFLAGALLGAGLLAGASLMFRNKTNQSSQSKNI